MDQTHLSGPLLAWHRAQGNVAESKNEQKNEPNLKLGSLTFHVKERKRQPLCQASSQRRPWGGGWEGKGSGHPWPTSSHLVLALFSEDQTP